MKQSRADRAIYLSTCRGRSSISAFVIYETDVTI